MSDRWHMVRDGDGLTLARHLPARFDLSAETRFPALRKGALAHEVRKDLWRLLRQIRGFSPVVRVVEDDAGMTLWAGGAVFGRMPPKVQVEAQIASLLASPEHRIRWIRHARIQKGPKSC
ncbi:hypothetical protein [Pseudoruegeria sp. SK021]|uniref:hypothetical protein n=1 Tax=Pseudoruegeria sp. SK021 TaxID=1933035 RepID=UPI000A24B49F|nr:hypothetical protein [Pseudoruegeria sp. SK021]OSP53832.1 hypothetical protein BV911_15830 [Pseudoruegeria sp. SK021]